MSLIEEYTEFLTKRGRAALTIRNYQTDIKIISRALEAGGHKHDGLLLYRAIEAPRAERSRPDVPGPNFLIIKYREYVN